MYIYSVWSVDITFDVARRVDEGPSGSEGGYAQVCLPVGPCSTAALRSCALLYIAAEAKSTALPAGALFDMYCEEQQQHCYRDTWQDVPRTGRQAASAIHARQRCADHSAERAINLWVVSVARSTSTTDDTSVSKCCCLVPLMLQMSQNSVRLCEAYVSLDCLAVKSADTCVSQLREGLPTAQQPAGLGRNAAVAIIVPLVIGEHHFGPICPMLSTPTSMQTGSAKLLTHSQCSKALQCQC